MSEVLTVTFALTYTLDVAERKALQPLLPVGADILSINGRDFVAFCDRCGAPICEGDGWHQFEDTYRCRACGWKEWNAEGCRHD